ncbi:pyruvate, phosphate dikinase [Sphingosinicella sp. CPCC 101087]|uniref:pyruvate, phosphate dikinase n=1 Tax=Sphingosinicella sp. CPCC 101087 TaxID=2497754 RepID=UPI00101D422F|nr:pyruvate, phosphate dikinase [Sphingosinicella sp. CPCC 101087]
MTQYVYRFGGGVSEGQAGDRNLLGGKGANLAEMSAIGLPVPPGFTICTEMCALYYREGERFPDGLTDEVATGIAHIEKVTGKKFGDPADPLLVSVRSGARVSMPGMMDTVLNLGLNDETVQGLAAASEDPRFAWDSYRRFIQMYSDVVLGLDHDAFEEALEIAKEDKGVHLDTDLEAEDWERLTARYKALVQEGLGRPFPEDPHDQLWGAIGAVFGSWNGDRAKTYRRLHHIPHDWGTAVNVQAMVFGNRGDSSATGVAFTRDPSTGERAYYGEYLINAQGEDVVAGIRTPQYLTRAAREKAGARSPSMEEALPEVYGQLAGVFETLERHYRDMQDIEFTVERGTLWMLQTRTGKRTAKAALKIAVDMAQEGLISEEEAVLRIDPLQLDQLLHPTLDPKAERDVIAKGLPASPGAACGKAVFDADSAVQRAGAGEDVILVRVETSPEDIHGMHAARGILTARGGMTSHAAVVARGMGRPCVSGAGAISIDYRNRRMRVGGREVAEGEVITLDGTTGEVMFGEVPTVQPELVGDFGTLMVWADSGRRLRVRTNAETPKDCRTALEFGAEGIGLCRTEHMFFDPDRITNVRQMILAQNETDRRAALDKLLPAQRGDFEEIFRIMEGLPVTIRLLDPPLHEFLPHAEEEFAEVARVSGTDVEMLRRRAAELAEANPMLGHRGCRLGITYPEIYEMQARAIFEAAVAVARDGATPPLPEVMVPLVATRAELAIIRALIERVAATVFEEQGLEVDYLVGTMIELPRAALAAADIAQEARFFSFGTNDLTQTALGVSRDDAGRFLGTYVEQGIFARDPFVSIDVEGVGELIAIAVERGRRSRPDLKLGICGEHGGDPASIGFCEQVGLDYVSASPYRVPIARLAAAQAALRKAKG